VPQYPCSHGLCRAWEDGEPGNSKRGGGLGEVLCAHRLIW
jgi:hypothetical protein